ncbi:glycosyltransferase [Rhodothermus sp. AH-315-K08]|nr:glycosyltransferase [Rhodothermus sp. AH-315-K08]
MIPTHNRADSLMRALRSVLAQTHKVLEVVVVADGCKDDTLKRVEAVRDQRVQIVPLRNNVGGAEARNIGISKCTGAFISFLDDDDEWLPNKTQAQLKAFREHRDASIVSCHHLEVNPFGAIVRSAPLEIRLTDLLYRNHCGSFSFCMVRRESIRGLRIGKTLAACQDWDLWIKILSVHPERARCRTVPQVLTHYHAGHHQRLSTNISNALTSRTSFLREHWPLMNPEQRHYQMFELTKMRRRARLERLSYVSRVRSYVKALRHYALSEYDQRVYNYLLLISKLVSHS